MKQVIKRIKFQRSRLQARALDVFVVAMGIGAVRLLALAVALLVARFGSDASTFGEYSLFITIYIIAYEMPSALDAAYIRFANGNNKGKIDATRSEGITLLLAAKVCFAAALCVFAALASTPIASYVLGRSGASSIVYWGVVSGAVCSVSSAIVVVYQSRRQFNVMSLFRVVPNGATFGLIGMAVLLDIVITKDVFMGGYFLIGVTLAMATIIMFRRDLSSGRDVKSFMICDFAKIGSSLSVSNILINLSSRLDIFLLTPAISFLELGIYGAAIRYATAASVVTGVVNTILLPKAPAALTTVERFTRYLLEAGIYLALQTCLLVVLLVFMEPIVLFAFGERFLGVIPYAQVLLLQTILVAAGIPFQALLQCGGRVSFLLYLSIGRFALVFALLKYLIPIYGSMGAAIAVTACAGALTLTQLVLVLVWCVPRYESCQ